MSYRDSITVDAGADLQTFQYRACAIGGTLATGVNARGILQNKPDNGEDATLAYQGRSKFQAGGAVSAGAKLTVSSGGFMTAAASGDAVVGFAEDAAVTSGSYGHGVFNFVSANGGNV